MRGIAFGLALTALGCGDPPPRAHASIWPEADELFHADPRWIGGDGAYSVDLGNDRTLWLFGDSFIADTPEAVRSRSRMVRNCIAVQTGRNPSNAFIQFHWREPEPDGQPLSYIPEEGALWFWPMHGVRIDDTLLLFYERVNAPEGDPNGFESNAWTAFVIHNPDDEPAQWVREPAILPASSHGLLVGEAAVVRGEFLYLYASDDDRHPAHVARVPLAEAREGKLDSMGFWGGSGWSGDPQAVVDYGAPEFSVHYDAKLGQFVMVLTEGYGATTLAWRVADSPEGPWSDPGDLLRPPESFELDAFVYAGKAHPELQGADLVTTYVPSSFAERNSYEDEHRLYYPHFVRVTY